MHATNCFICLVITVRLGCIKLLEQHGVHAREIGDETDELNLKQTVFLMLLYRRLETK